MAAKPRTSGGISGAGGKNVAETYKPYVTKLPNTPKQAMAIGKLQMSPKTSTTLFTTPKGTAKLPQAEIDAIQTRRVADRKRTLARAEAIIRRTR